VFEVVCEANALKETNRQAIKRPGGFLLAAGGIGEADG